MAPGTGSTSSPTSPRRPTLPTPPSPRCCRWSAWCSSTPCCGGAGASPSPRTEPRADPRGSSPGAADAEERTGVVAGHPAHLRLAQTGVEEKVGELLQALGG